MSARTHDAAGVGTGTMRHVIGRGLCFALGFLYAAGAVPLFTFGSLGEQLWAFVQAQTQALGAALGLPGWLVLLGLSPFIIGGPLALVWRIAGPGVSRMLWLVAGALAYGVYRAVS